MTPVSRSYCLCSAKPLALCLMVTGACAKIIVAERWLRSEEMWEENREGLEERLKITSKIPFQ